MFKSIRIATGLAFLATALDAGAQTTDYKSLHNLLIQFYGYQRAGDKTIDNKNPFYKASPFPHSQDNLGGKDLSSGWYDAGDFVKFGLPFGFSVYCLLKGYDVFPRGYDDVTSWDYKGAADQIPDILGEVKIATDYMQRAVLSSSQIVVDVGNAQSDHQSLSEDGYTNSQRTSPRQVYTGGGADVAGLYAASLALMSTLYKPYDAAYSAACLAKAKDAFTFAVANQKLSSEQPDGSTFFYSTKTYFDKLACGAVELFRATKDSSYFTQAKTFQAKVVQHFFVLGYANVGDISSFELTRLGQNATGVWLSDVQYTMGRVVKAATASPLIKGAFINSDWGNAGNAACAGFSAALAFMVTGESSYLDFARNQAHWVAGISPFTQSYVVGYGNGPTAPHHRNDVARLNGVRLKGGVVSGPMPTGAFDASKPEASSWTFNGGDANTYQNTEVALNYNAGMVGLIGFLRDYDNPPAGLVRITTALTATPGNVDLSTSGTANIAGTLASSMAWKIVLRGRSSGAVKTLTGTGSAISVKWGGEVDSGSFVVGEAVDVKLDVPNIASYHLLRAATSFYITGLKKEDFKTTDVLVDDFEGTGALTKQGGPWTIFTDQPNKGTSSTNPATMAAAILAGEGESATKGVSIRLIGSAGAAHPNAGIRATFNAASTAVGLGKPTSVVFDVKSTAGSSLWLEVEQTDITDGAYFAKKIDFAGDTWNRIRVPFTSLAQPDWKSSAKSLNLNSVTGLRFTYYGTSNVRFNLDNIHIENLSITSAPVHSLKAERADGFSLVNAGKGGVTYRFPPAEGSAEAWTAELMDFTGRVLATQKLRQVRAGQKIQIQGLHLNPGWYFIRHTAPGIKQAYINGLLIDADHP